MICRLLCAVMSPFPGETAESIISIPTTHEFPIHHVPEGKTAIVHIHHYYELIEYPGMFIIRPEFRVCPHRRAVESAHAERARRAEEKTVRTANFFFLV